MAVSVHDHVISVAELICHFLPLLAAPSCFTSRLNNVEDLLSMHLCGEPLVGLCMWERPFVFRSCLKRALCLLLFSVITFQLMLVNLTDAVFLLLLAVCKAAVDGKLSTTQSRDSSALLKSHRWLQYLLSAERMNLLCPLLHCAVNNNITWLDWALILKRLPVLLKYLNSDTERQLQALYGP